MKSAKSKKKPIAFKPKFKLFVAESRDSDDHSIQIALGVKSCSSSSDQNNSTSLNFKVEFGLSAECFYKTN